MLASGRLPPDALPGDLAGQECIPGLEFSGRDSRGRRVMGMVAARSLATTVLADPAFLWEVPSNWSLEQASSVPVVYGTVSTSPYVNSYRNETRLKTMASFFRHITL